MDMAQWCFCVYSGKGNFCAVDSVFSGLESDDHCLLSCENSSLAHQCHKYISIVWREKITSFLGRVSSCCPNLLGDTIFEHSLISLVLTHCRERGMDFLTKNNIHFHGNLTICCAQYWNLLLNSARYPRELFWASVAKEEKNKFL